MSPEDADVTRRIEDAADRAATRAIELSRVEADRAQQLAVARAVKDANVDRDLNDHARHLEQINGSQRAMAASLEEMRRDLMKISDSFRQQMDATKVISDFVGKQTTAGFNRRSLWIAGLLAFAAYGSIVITLIIKFGG